MSTPSRVQTNHAFPNTREAILRDQHRQLRALLAHIWKHSAFYQEYYRSYGIREGDLGDLTVRDLPFITKPTLMEHFDRAVTDPRLHKSELEQWLQEHRDPRDVFHRDFVVLHSSGSSGHMAIFVYDRTAWQVLNTTIVTRFPIPERDPPQKTRVACYKATHGHFAGAINAVRMPKALYDVLMLSMLDSSAHAVDQLQAFQPHRLVGYSSSIAMLAEWALQGVLRIRPETVVAGGDLLTDSMERQIQEAWGAPIYLNYGTTESIYLAVRAPGQADMTVMDDLNILEILDNDHQGVPPGGEGRVVLTNLYNYALPILRYELGDYVVRGPDRHDPAFSTIRQIQGRASDALPIMLDDGTHDTIHPIVLAEFYAVGLERIQFISLRPEHVRLEYLASYDIGQAIREEFHRLLVMKGASRTTFEVQRVPHFTNDPRTGKFHLVRLHDSPMARPPTVLTSHTPQATPQGVHGRPNPTFVAFEKAEVEQSIPERFEHQVRRYPERLAVKTREHALTYAALNTAANRVAHALLAEGGADQAPVALLLEHDAPVIVTILGALKAGKTYIPLDPSFPKARLAYMLEDSQAGIILTNSRNLALAEALNQGAPRVCNIDTLGSTLPAENPHLPIAPDRFASIFYTSGSAGQPKGVIQNHRNVLHKIMKYTNDIHICPDDRLVLLASCSVGAAVWNMFGALLNGASLCPIDVKHEVGMAHLATRMRQERITIYHSTPSVFRHFAGSLTDGEQFPELRLIRLAGEPVYKQDVELYKRYFSQDCLLYVGLASTETGCISQFIINRATQIHGNTVPAGYPVEDIDVLLLDDDGRVVGVDQIGEIAVRSRYLSPGYWHRAELTDAVFMPDVTGGEARIYRTGDLGLMRPNGCLEHLGRKDWQVKIRGYRVEIPEIEMALLELDTLKEAVVVAREDGSGDKRLVAYVVPSGPSVPTVGTLRRALVETLPDYMVPSVFMMTDTLPLTPNGKVDRSALPLPDSVYPQLDTPYVAPCTAIEGALATIWGEILHLQRVGIHDDFFELGGHSLLATQILARVSRTWGTDVPLRAFFESPTVAGMALVVTEHQIKRLDPEELERLFAEIERIPEGA